MRHRFPLQAAPAALLLTLALLSACQSLPPLPVWRSPEGREHAELGVILDLRSGERLSPKQLVEQLAGAERVFEMMDEPQEEAPAQMQEQKAQDDPFAGLFTEGGK